MDGGERGIRTPGGLPLNGFQDRRFRPLSQLSEKLDYLTVCTCCHYWQRGSDRRTTRDFLSLAPLGPSALRFDVPNSVLLFGRPLSQLSR